MTTKIKKRLVKLPSDVLSRLNDLCGGAVRDDYVRSLRKAGWTLQAISEGVGVSRERVRQICEMSGLGMNLAEDLPVPTPPISEPRPKKHYQEPAPDLLARALELQPYAQQVRANGTRFRKEAEEYTSLVYSMTISGVTLYRIAKCLGVTHGALRFRLTRYGYMSPPVGKLSSVYKPIKKENRSY